MLTKASKCCQIAEGPSVTSVVRCCQYSTCYLWVVGQGLRLTSGFLGVEEGEVGCGGGDVMV